MFIWKWGKLTFFIQNNFGISNKSITFATEIINKAD